MDFKVIFKSVYVEYAASVAVLPPVGVYPRWRGGDNINQYFNNRR